MPEGDTVWLTAKRLDSALAGATVTTFELRVPTLATADLRDDTVTEVVARGKHILMRFAGGLTLHSHLRMDGAWRVSAAGTGPRRSRSRRGDEHQIRALVGNASWLALGVRVHDLRLVHTHPGEGELVGHLGPDLLGPDWDLPRAVERLGRRADRAIGEALLDQTNLAGIGNMYKSETLFVVGVNPWLPTAQVPALDRVVETAHRLLRANRDHPEQSTTGKLARGQQHWVYLRAAQPCRRCGTAITVAAQGPPPQQRATYWCPRCQPGPDSAPGFGH